MNRELGWSMASIGVFLLTMVLPFVYFIRDCRRRDASDFPVLSYGAKTVSSFTVKRVWTWILILAFLSCTNVNMDIFSNTMEVRETITTGTSEYVRPPSDTSYSLTVPPPLKYELKNVEGNKVYEKIALSIPWLFLVGLFLYDRGVRKWPQGEQKDES